MTTRKSFALISGLLFAGMIANSISQRIPIQIVQANQTDNVNEASLELPSVRILEEISAEKKEAPKYAPNPKKVKAIRTYLSSRNAPLAEYAEEFVRAADYYEIDYRLVAAISVIESNGPEKALFFNNIGNSSPSSGFLKSYQHSYSSKTF